MAKVRKYLIIWLFALLIGLIGCSSSEEVSSSTQATEAAISTPVEEDLTTTLDGPATDEGVVVDIEVYDVTPEDVDVEEDPSTEDPTLGQVASESVPQTLQMSLDQTVAPVPEWAINRFGRGGIEAFSLSPTNNHVVVGGHLGAYLYDLNSFEEKWFYPTVGRVTGIAYSPDGTMVAISWGADADWYNPGTDILDAASGGLLVQTRHQHRIGSAKKRYRNASWSPDNTRIVIGSEHAPAEIWDLSGNLIASHEVTEFESKMTRWSPDGSKIAAIDAKQVRIWDPTSGMLIKTFPEEETHINSIAWSPDGTMLAVGFDQELTLLDTETWRVKERSDLVIMEVNGEWETRSDDNLGLTFSPDQTKIAASGMDGSVLIWDIETGKQPRIITSGKRGGGDIAWSSITDKIIFASRDNALLIIDPETGLVTGMIDDQVGPAYRLAWSPDEKRIASGGIITRNSDGRSSGQGGEIAVWDVETGDLIKKISDRGFGVAWSPDGTHLATGAPPITIYDTDLFEPVSILGDDPSVEYYVAYRFTHLTGLDWSTGGDYLLQAEVGRYPDHDPELWDYSTSSQILSNFVPYDKDIDNFKLSPDGEFIAVSVDGTATSIMSIPSGKEVARLPHGKSVWQAGWINGSNQIALWYGSSIDVWDIPSGNLASTVEVDHYYRGGGFSQDGMHIAAFNASLDKDLSLDILDVRTGALLDTIPVDYKYYSDEISWSPSGRYLALSLLDGTIVALEPIYSDAETPEELEDGVVEEDTKNTTTVTDTESVEEPDNETVIESSTEAEATHSLDSQNPLSGQTVTSSFQRQKDSMTMVYVPAGTFEMGSTNSDIDLTLGLCRQNKDNCDRRWFEDELPKHEIYLDDFWIDQTEVTNAQFAAFLNDQGNQIEGTITWYALDDPDTKIELDGSGSYRAKDGFSNHPATLMTWYAAKAYCIWVGGDLPTEAQWEYAAKGLENIIFPWGNDTSGVNMNYCDANCPTEGADRSVNDLYEKTAPVKSYENNISWVGAYDMAGNVWERVNDWYGEDYYTYTPSQNPQGPGAAGDMETKVLRGGSWRSPLHYTRTTVRNSIVRRSHYRNDYGFRCVVSEPHES